MKKTRKRTLAVLCMAFCLAIASTFMVFAAAADGETASVYTTGDDMLANPTKCLTGFGGTQTKIEKGYIYSAANGYFAYDEEVTGVDITMQYTTAECNITFMYLRGKSPSGSDANPDTMHGYMAFITASSAKTNVGFYRLPNEGEGGWQHENTVIGSVDIADVNLMDGKPHRIKYSAVDKGDDKTEISFEVVGSGTPAFVKETKTLPIEGTSFYTSYNAWGPADQEYRIVSSEVPEETDYITTADMLKSTSLLDGLTDEASRIRPSLDIAKSVNGVMVYNKAIEGAIVDVKVTEGDSLVFALSAKETAMAGEGYYYKVSKDGESGTKVELIMATQKTRPVTPAPTDPEEGEEGEGGEDENHDVETASETEGEGEGETEEGETETYIDFEVLATVTKSDVNFFDGELHTVKLAAAKMDGFVFKVDETDFLPDEEIDLSEIEIMDNTGTAFVITFDASDYGEDEFPAFEMHGENATTISGTTEDAYSVYTSKSLLVAASLWETFGADVSTGVAKSIQTGENRVMYSLTLENAMYKFDIDLSKVTGGNWVGFALNANKLDAPWNAGYHSIMVRIEGNKNVIIEEWAGQTTYDKFNIPELDFSKRMTIECGIYNVTADNGKKYTFLRLVINGKEYYNNDLPYGAYGSAGALSILAFGADWAMYATEDEQAQPPALIGAEQEERGDESDMTETIAVTDWAPVMNSFAPAYKYDGDEMILGGNGDVAYKTAVNFSKLSFDFKFAEDADAKGQYLQFFFNRKRQEQFMTSASGGDLTLDASNYGYGVRILPTGIIELIYTQRGNNSARRMLMSASGLLGINFTDGEFHTMTVYRELLSGGGLKITLFFDDVTTGYSYTQTDYSSDYIDNCPMEGFLSFSHSTTKTSAAIKNIKFEGTERETSADYKANALNFVTFYPSEDEEIRGNAYFVPYGADAKTKWVEMYGLDENGETTELLGRAFVPDRALPIPATYTGDSVRLVAVGFTAAGNYTVDLKLVDTEEEYTVPQDKVERIAIQESETGAYFIYADSKTEYMPVGANYMGLRGGDHSTFDAATSFTDADYDPVKTDAMMREFAAAGGNVLRVFIIGRTSTNPGISGDNTIPVTDEKYYFEGLYLPYMENVAHFLAKAKQYGVYVMVTLGDADVPSNSYYLSLMGGAMLPRNKMYLDNRGILARTTYARNVVRYFTEKHPELVPAIFSIAFQNEFAMNGNEEPFTLSEGTFTAPNDKTYDLSDAQSRQALFEESVIYYLNAMTKAVKDVDPNMLVNEGSYTLNIVGNGEEVGCPPIPAKGDPRYPARFDVYLASDIDFLDVHIYFRNTNNNTILSSFQDDMRYMHRFTDEVEEYLKKKCLFMGEFGASKNYAPNWDEPNNNSIPSAHDIYVDSVRLAKEAGFRGFAVWTLESHLQTTWWNLLSPDGTLGTLKEMIEEMHDGGEVKNITADAASGFTGDEITINVKGTKTGDSVYFRVGDGAWTTNGLVFDTAGEHTVQIRVVRAYVGYCDVSTTVTVEAKPAPPEEDPPKQDEDEDEAGCGCGGQIDTVTIAGALMFFAAVSVLVARKKKKHNN